MSDSFLNGIKHAHTLFVVVFTIHYLFKSILFFSGKKERLAKYQAKTKVLLDMIVPTLFIITGVILFSNIDMGTIGVWFHVKLTLILVLIPVAIIGFKKEIRILIIMSCLILIYLIALAFTKHISLFA